MSLTLKDCVNPWKSADQRLSVSGQIPLADMQRLASALLPSNGVVEVEMEFERNEENLAVLTGKLQTILKLQCQRCLQPMELPVNSRLSMAFIRETDRDSELSERYELHEVQAESICLVNVIEDELLLLIPQVPMHFAPECVIETEFGDAASESVGKEKENPFAILASLKENLDS
jgi:uncharacterized protein